MLTTRFYTITHNDDTITVTQRFKAVMRYYFLASLLGIAILMLVGGGALYLYAWSTDSFDDGFLLNIRVFFGVLCPLIYMMMLIGFVTNAKANSITTLRYIPNGILLKGHKRSLTLHKDTIEIYTGKFDYGKIAVRITDQKQDTYIAVVGSAEEAQQIVDELRNIHHSFMTRG